ncbi:MAG: hypothetical protein HY820_00550 [Acidobacteria bacterium]|nr:hypothetical protein [Acidobacteriota bacterium]
MENDRGGANAGVLFGAVLVVVGSVLLMERLDFLPTNLLGHFWPLAFLVAGSAMFINGRQLAGGLLVFAGIVIELRKLHIIHVSIWELWPLAIIAVGVLMLWRALFPPRIIPGEVHTAESRLNEYAVFGGSDIKGESQSFQGGSASAIFGGVELDLRGARITNSPAVLYADAIFGGVELKVPETWRVTADGQVFFGGIDSRKTLTPRASGEPEQHLIVKGLVVFGGVNVKN